MNSRFIRSRILGSSFVSICAEADVEDGALTVGVAGGACAARPIVGGFGAALGSADHVFRGYTSVIVSIGGR
jgi:hypothetical protein